MLALLQRVSQANVTVSTDVIAQITVGIVAFIAIEKKDNESTAERLMRRILGYRIFSDSTHRMNHSIQDVQGDLLLVPQFTLAADTSKGMRPSFTPAADPKQGETLFDYLVDKARQNHAPVEVGKFGAVMYVNLSNDGPVTFLLRCT